MKNEKPRLLNESIFDKEKLKELDPKKLKQLITTMSNYI